MWIKPVGTDARNTKEFIELPVRLYKGVSNWIRPLDTDIEEVFHLETNKMFRSGECERWILENDWLEKFF